MCAAQLDDELDFFDEDDYDDEQDAADEFERVAAIRRRLRCSIWCSCVEVARRCRSLKLRSSIARWRVWY